jgi:SulP family sulfate permease
MIAIVRAAREGRLTRRALPREALAGLVVGIVAIPLAMAFAIASGVKPEQGLVTAIVAGVLVSLLGGSHVQIAGPTGAFIVILLKIVQDHGPQGLMVATMMAGGILILLGAARLGGVIRYIPHPVTIGFTAGIAVVIFTGQVADFFGLTLSESPREFVDRLGALARASGTVSGPTVLVAGITLAVLVAFPRLTKRVPSPLVAMLAGTGAVAAFGLDGVATIGSRFGEIPSAFPPFQWPWAAASADGAARAIDVSALVGPALTIAMLGSIESLLSAVVADGMTGDRHDSNQELIGQGVANVVAPLFGGFAATGAIARTATNVRNGGRTPLSGVVHALVLLVTMLVLAPYATYIPLASLAAILFVVAWNMSEPREVFELLRRGARGDRLVLLVTFSLTVFVDLVVAVEVGVVLAAILFMKHMSDRVDVKAVRDAEAAPDPFHELASRLPPEIAVYSVDGPLFFGVSHRFESTVGALDPAVRIVILRLWRVPYLDASGVASLRRAVRGLRRGGRRVLVSGVQPRVLAAMERAGLVQEIGEEKIWANLEEALAAARDLLVEIRAAERAAGKGVPLGSP